MLFCARSARVLHNISTRPNHSPVQYNLWKGFLHPKPLSQSNENLMPGYVFLFKLWNFKIIRHAVLYEYVSSSNNSEQLQLDIMFKINSGEEQNLEMLVITFQVKNSYYIYLSKTQQIKFYI
jgi:hypothetical protein